MTFAENHLLSLIPRPDRLRLIAIAEPLYLELGTVLCEPGEPTRHAYFPTIASSRW